MWPVTGQGTYMCHMTLLSLAVGCSAGAFVGLESWSHHLKLCELGSSLAILNTYFLISKKGQHIQQHIIVHEFREQ